MYEPLSDSQLKALVARIWSGDKGTVDHGPARAVIADFFVRQAFHMAQSQVTLDWLAEVLSDILDHADPHEALQLAKRPSNRPTAPKVAIEVAWWIELTRRRGYSATEAKELAASTFHYDFKHIERIAREQSKWVRAMNPDVDWDEYFLTRKPARPLPRARNKN